jgi:hypothetical protein
MWIAQPRTESRQAKPPDKNTLSPAPGEVKRLARFLPDDKRRKHYGFEKCGNAPRTRTGTSVTSRAW